MPVSACLLPLDDGRIVVPSPNTPELVLKHRDGELVRLSQTRKQTYSIERRHATELSWERCETLPTLPKAVVALADIQAFGVQTGGAPTGTSPEQPAGPNPYLELEPLDRGGLAVDQVAQLPIIVRTTDRTTWRLRYESGHYTDDSQYGTYYFEQQPEADWQLVEKTRADHHVTQALTAFEEYADITVVPTTATTELISHIDDANPTFEHLDHDEAHLSSTAAHIQNRTVPMDE